MLDCLPILQEKIRLFYEKSVVFFLEMAESNSNVIDFRGRNRQEKIQLVLEIITKFTNFNPEYPNYDWSTAAMPLHVSNMLFLSFIHSLN